MFENRMLRRIFGPKRDDVKGELSKLHNELNDLSSPNVVWVIKLRRMRHAGHVARMGERRDVYRGNPKENDQRPRHRWEDNIKMDLQEMGLEVMDWMDLAWDGDRWWVLVNVVMDVHFP